MATFFGAGIWVVILTALGYLMGSQEELLRANLHRITIGALVFVVVSTLIYVIYRRRRARSRS